MLLLAAAVSAMFLTSCTSGKPPDEGAKAWSFNEDKAGVVPEGWQPAETRGEGTPATWAVVQDAAAPGAPHVVAITKNRNYGGTFNLLMAGGTRYRDATIQVRVKAVAGKEDQGGGPVWRARDADNYYIARWNPLENNFRVYFVKDGRRKQLESATVNTDAAAWHTIRIVHQGTRIEARFDGKILFEVEDATFAEAGRVGLWVKADGLTAFDDLTVEPR